MIMAPGKKPHRLPHIRSVAGLHLRGPKGLLQVLQMRCRQRQIVWRASVVLLSPHSVQTLFFPSFGSHPAHLHPGRLARHLGSANPGKRCATRRNGRSCK
jgi:hypothetical protein